MPPKTKLRPITTIINSTSSRNSESISIERTKNAGELQSLGFLSGISIPKRKRSGYNPSTSITHSISEGVASADHDTMLPNSEEENHNIGVQNSVFEEHIEEVSGDISPDTSLGVTTSRRGRGPTGWDVVFPKSGKKWDCIIINDQATGVGGQKLSVALGLYARSSNFFPVYKDWKDQSHHIVVDITNELKTKYFNFLDKEGNEVDIIKAHRICKMSIQKKLREWRCELKIKYYNEGGLEQLQVCPDTRITEDDWKALLAIWRKEEKITESTRNKKSRAEQVTMHTLGSRSYARLKEEKRIELGDNYSELAIYLDAHKKTNDTYISENARIHCENVIERYNARDISSNSEPGILSSVLDEVCGGHHGGYERGQGLGWSRKIARDNRETYGLHNSTEELQRKLSKSLAENEDLRKRLERLEAVFVQNGVGSSNQSISIEQQSHSHGINHQENE